MEILYIIILKPLIASILLRVNQLKLIKNRLLKNLNHHSMWNQEEIKNTSMQLPAFGKGMPDFISMSGDHLMGEGRKDAWERGGMQSVTEMAYRLYTELKNAEATGTKLDAVKLIEEFMTEGQRWDKRGMAGIRSIAQDLVWFGAGSVPYLWTGNPIVITGGAFALHGALRHALIETYMQNFPLVAMIALFLMPNEPVLILGLILTSLQFLIGLVYYICLRQTNTL